MARTTRNVCRHCSPRADYSYLNEVVITGKQGVTVHKGSLLSDDNRTKWVTLADVTLGSNGSARVDLRSQELGAFSLPANRPLTMDTVTIGVDSITTTKAAKEGALRKRMAICYYVLCVRMPSIIMMIIKD